jgi:hypothetical protein
MAKDYTSLLGKSSGTSWGEIAGAYLSGGRKKDNRARNVMLATLFFNAKEANMQSKVMKNLQEMERQKTFDNAQMTDRWNAYNTLMDEDAAFKENPNYFRLQAEARFAKNNPNYPSGAKLLQSEIDFKNKEVTDLEEALKNLHIEKIKSGNVNKRLSKQEFFKPFEDYYVNKQEEIAAPGNVSLVHKAWNKLTNKNDKQTLTDIQKENQRNEAIRNNFGYLLNPDEITGDAAIAQYKPLEMTVTKTEAANQILSSIENQDIARNLVTGLKQKQYSRTELQDYITLNVVDFNPYIQKYQKAYQAYDARFYADKDVPVEGDKGYKEYIIQRNAYADRVTGQGDKVTAQITSDLYTLKELKVNPEENAELIDAIEARISGYTTSAKDTAVFNIVAAHISDTNVMRRVNTDIQNGLYDDVADYALQYTKTLRNTFKNL